jgi:putative membrane protein
MQNSFEGHTFLMPFSKSDFMKTLYKKTSANFMLFAVMMFAVSCSSNLTYNEATSKNEREIKDPEKLKDARFLEEAKSFNLLEMKLTENAITKAYASAVVDMARKHLGEYKDMNDDLGLLAKKKKIALPSAMNEKHQAYFNDVITSGRENFDREFIQMVRKLNDENKDQYVNMATEAKDGDIRAFAARKLDMLRNQATKMDETEKQLMNTY